MRKLAIKSLLGGVVAAIATPFFTPYTAYTVADLQHLQFGWPFPFLQQWSPLTPPDHWFPHTFARLLNPQANPTSLLLPHLLGSIAVFAIAWFTLGLVCRRLVSGSGPR